MANDEKNKSTGVNVGQVANGSAMRDAKPPALPRPRMPLAQRAKIFIPFDPLKGYQDALRQKEREAEAAHWDRAPLDDTP